MKTLELKLPTPVLVVWGLPEDTKLVQDWSREWLLADKKIGWSQIIGKVSSNWQLIGKLSELTEEQAKELVHVSIHTGLSAHYTKGVNPPNVYCYRSSLQSLQSAVESSGHESKTLPANTLIFKRV